MTNKIPSPSKPISKLMFISQAEKFDILRIKSREKLMDSPKNEPKILFDKLVGFLSKN